MKKQKINMFTSFDAWAQRKGFNILEKFNRCGGNSLPNTLPLLTGLTFGDLPKPVSKTWEDNVDLKFVFETFKTVTNLASLLCNSEKKQAYSYAPFVTALSQDCRWAYEYVYGNRKFKYKNIQDFNLLKHFSVP
jgi:hypothetical protein